eukprot:GEMP01054307.1.p1 GENE.GEMP01054307.1~~GEMP01054307.1.p1  ORF type:complete len:222 (+),score=34.16 GEMP01054307.1:506-1171(+)
MKVRKGDRLFDCCTGGGTFAAMGLDMGLEVHAFDVRREFLDNAKRNVLSLGYECPFIERDWMATNIEEHPDSEGAFIIANMPWGHRFGNEEDALFILDGILRVFPKAARVAVMVSPKVAPTCMLHLDSSKCIRYGNHAELLCGTPNGEEFCQPERTPEETNATEKRTEGRRRMINSWKQTSNYRKTGRTPSPTERCSTLMFRSRIDDWRHLWQHGGSKTRQ